MRADEVGGEECGGSGAKLLAGLTANHGKCSMRGKHFTE